VGKHDAPRGRQGGSQPAGPARDGRVRRIARTYAAGARVVRGHPELWAVPVMAVIVAGTFGVIAAMLFASHPVPRQGWVDAVGIIAGAVVIAVVVMLSNVALVYVTDQVLRGKMVNPFAIGVAMPHRMAVARCLISQAGGGVCMVMVTVLQLAWGPFDWYTPVALVGGVSVLCNSSGVKVSYLMPPIIALEKLRYRDAAQRLDELVRQTWRKTNGSTGIAAAGTALFLPVLAVVLAAVWLASGRVDLAAAANRPALLILLGWGAVVWVLTSAVQAVYRVALYRFAVEGVAMPPFAAGDLELAFGRLEAA
jgi:hypothetical protein